MEKMLSQFRDSIEKIEERVLNRGDYYNGRTKKWQDSEKGEEYDDKTGELIEVQDDLQTVIDSLETYLGY